MDDHTGFLQEIIAHPEDDVPRLIYADWLEEQGNPRGEFIRLQCEMPRMPSLPSDWPEPDQRLLNRIQRILELQEAHQLEWIKELNANFRDFQFNRGFIDSVTITANQFLKRGEKILNATPLEWLRLTHLPSRIPDLIKSPLLQSVRGFDFGKLSISVHALKSILESPQLTSLRHLNVEYANQRLSQLGRVLATTQFASQLKELYLRGSELDDKFFAGLGSEGGFPELRHFGFGGGMSRTRPLHFQQLSMPRLDSLDVGGQLRVVDCEELCHLPLAQLQHFDLSKTKLPAKGMQVLTETGVFESVSVLLLDRCNLSEKAGIALLTANDLSNCQRLSLTDNDRLGNDFIQALTSSPHLRSLQALDLRNIPLTADNLLQLANQENMPQLKFLNVSNATATPKAQSALKERYGNGLNLLSLRLNIFPGWT